MDKRRYQFFTTTLPDEFVEANAADLTDACKHWQNPNQFIRHAIIIGGVNLSLCGSRKAHMIPMIVSNSPTQINNWMSKYGDSFNGRYWEAFAQDNGRADRKSNQRAGLPAATWRTHSIAPPPVGPAGPGQGPGLDPKHVQDMMDLIRQHMTHVLLYGGPSPIAFTGFRSLLNGIEERSPPLKRESIACGEIIGYRCWLVITASGRPLLRSVYQTDYWNPNAPLTGRGLEDWDSRGIHAWKEPNSEKFFEYIRGYMDGNHIHHMNTNMPIRPAMVTGSVALWGDVVEHEHGYRAEFARIKSIDWLYPDREMMGRELEVLAHLRKLYGVDHD